MRYVANGHGVPVRTTADVVRAVEHIRSSAADPEAAHAMTDRLHIDVLTTVAHGLVPLDLLPDLAAAALVTEEIDFPRWCA